MNWLNKLICKIRGKHRWSRRKGEAGKHCSRCGVKAAVKRRVVQTGEVK